MRNLVVRGLLNRRINYGWSWKPITNPVGVTIARPAINSDKVEMLRRIILLVKGHNVKLILLLIPGTDIYTQNNIQQFRETDRILMRISSDAKVEYDKGMEYISTEHDKFFDPDHLNSLGKKILTTHIASKLSNSGLSGRKN